jgi:biopolymer transport protein ExbB
MFRRTLATAALALACLFLAAPVALAEDAAPPAADLGSGTVTVKQILEDGGTVGWIILALSVASLAMIIEYSVNIRRDKICRPELIDEVEALLEENEVQEAVELCEADPNFFTNMMGAALAKVHLGYGEMKTAMENQGGVEVLKLQQKVGWMLWISNIGPLLGLFGTVTGMIAAFNVIEALGSAVTPTDLAKGISAALITTFDGLIVSMPTVTAYQYFRNKAARIAIDFGGIAEDMIERYRTR